MHAAPAEPAYLALHRTGELCRRAAGAAEYLAECALCPRRCRVNRLAGEKGFCRTGSEARVASYAPHFGEESVLVGEGGSGTIFFTGCNLGCVFCQNWEISHEGVGVTVTAGQLAAVMVSLQKQGCGNINFVTPSHLVPQILAALDIAAGRGLSLPLVYNSGGYDSLDTLGLLDGVVDIYMPDFKFWNPATAGELCGAADYPHRAREAVREMHRQVGDLQVGADGLARRGLLVRHLVMPGQLAETGAIMKFLADEISAATYVNVMEQYRPCGDARRHPAIDRMLEAGEYRQAMELARAAGLSRLDDRNWQRLLYRLAGG
ncbi:MAG: radical SAM protein [Thermodesulfobacteriota bacterium]